MKLSYGLCVTGLAVYLAARIATTPAWATPGENIESVHFDNMEPAFGTVPRRALLWADRDSRITRGNGGEGGSWESGQLGVELPQAYDSAGKRVTAWKTVRRAAERAVAEGRWRQATRLFTREAEAFGWRIARSRNHRRL